jgi:UDP-3-O-[3-hydroxymyristoyl] glucosamine N-acyltransferase
MVASTAYVEAGAQVGDRSRIGAGSWLDHDVIVGKDVVVAANVHLGPRTRAEDGTWIGTGARVGSDVVIGRGARVAPDTVVRDAAVVACRLGPLGVRDRGVDRVVPVRTWPGSQAVATPTGSS